MSYLSLSRRVPEASAIEPKALASLYSLISYLPVANTAYDQLVAGALSLGVTQGRALDLGTGPGFVAVEIARQRPGLCVVGLDLAAHMVEKATLRAAPAQLDGRGLWLQADGHDLPLADNSFDLVISSFALHHWDDPLRILNEIARVLRRPETTKEGRSGYYIADISRQVRPLERLFAYATIPAVSLAFGSYRGYGGYYESVRAGYTCAEAQALLDQSELPPGEVRLESTWLIPILTLTSRRGG